MRVYILLLALLASQAFAFPSLLSLDGYLTNSSGSARNGSHQFVFSLYTSGNSLLWTENQSLTVSSGKLNALLGSVTALNLSFDQDYYLGVKVNTDSEMTPKYRIAASAYSYHAETADTAKNLAFNASAMGGLRLANDDSACTISNAGTFRWTGVNLEFCTGKAWKYITGTNDGTIQAQAGLSCNTIKTGGFSTGDGAYWIDPNGGSTSDAFQAYCDMTTDGGGWTLVGTYPKTQTPIADWASYSSTPQLSPQDPANNWLYKGGLGGFVAGDVREQISCTGSPRVCLNSYRIGASESDLDIIRKLWGYNSKLAAAPQYTNVPACTVNYAGGVNNIASCTPYTGAASNTIFGWAIDLNQGGHSSGSCWAGRGAGYSTQGSALCAGDPNGSQWALLWFK